MSYLATVASSFIDTTNIKNILVQGESEHPEIIFSLDPSYTGLTWHVRGAYLSFNAATESSAITPTETVDAVTVSWTVDSSFTTMYGALQLILVGIDGSEETIVRAAGYVNVERDWSGESVPAITLNLFEELLARANVTISRYPYIDETSGNWFVWNTTLEVYEDTEVHAQGEQGIQGVQGIQGEPGIDGDDGADGVGVPTGGTTNQALLKNSATDYDDGWYDIPLLSGGKVLASQTSADIVAVSAGRTLALTDAGKCLLVGIASDGNMTIPTNASVAFDIDTEIEITQTGAGKVTIVPDSGVTLNAFLSAYTTSGQYAVASLKKIDTDTWLLVGVLE